MELSECPRCDKRGWKQVAGYNPEPRRRAHSCRYFHLWVYDDEEP